MTDHHDRIYSQDWRDWQDPEVPEYFNPTNLLLDKHMAMAAADRVALMVDTEPYTYRQVLAHVCRAAGGLTELGLAPGARILLFGTDSLEFVATWLGAVRAGVVPAVVSDAYKAPMLRYFLWDTAATALFIDAEQLEKLDEVADELPPTLRYVIVRGEAAELRGRHFVLAQEFLDGSDQHAKAPGRLV